MIIDYEKFMTETAKLHQRPDKEKCKEYLLLLDEVQFALADYDRDLPRQKAVKDLTIEKRTQELLDSEEEKHISKAQTRANVENEETILICKTDEGMLAYLKNLVVIGERAYYHARREVEGSKQLDGQVSMQINDNF